MLIIIVNSLRVPLPARDPLQKSTGGTSLNSLFTIPLSTPRSLLTIYRWASFPLDGSTRAVTTPFPLLLGLRRRSLVGNNL